MAPLVLGPGRLPLGQGLDFSGSPVPASPPVATVGPAVPYCLPHNAPSFVYSLTPSQSALMYRLPSCAECVPPTWLAPGLDQGPSSLLPARYQFWSFRAAPPSLFQAGTEDRPICAGEGSSHPGSAWARPHPRLL